MLARERREPSVYVHPVQRGNPFYPFAEAGAEEREMTVDYFFPSLATGALFLSFEYHCQAPLYIARKLERLRKSAEHAEIALLLLCLVVDAADGQDYILDLQLLCGESGVKVLCFKNGAAFAAFLRERREEARPSSKRFSFTHRQDVPAKPSPP